MLMWKSPVRESVVRQDRQTIHMVLRMKRLYMFVFLPECYVHLSYSTIKYNYDGLCIHYPTRVSFSYKKYRIENDFLQDGVRFGSSSHAHRVSRLWDYGIFTDKLIGRVLWYNRH